MYFGAKANGIVNKITLSISKTIFKISPADRFADTAFFASDDFIKSE